MYALVNTIIQELLEERTREDLEQLMNECQSRIKLHTEPTPPEEHIHQYVFGGTNVIHLNPVGAPFVTCDTCGELTPLVDAVNYYTKHRIV